MSTVSRETRVNTSADRKAMHIVAARSHAASSQIQTNKVAGHREMMRKKQQRNLSQC